MSSILSKGSSALLDLPGSAHLVLKQGKKVTMAPQGTRVPVTSVSQSRQHTKEYYNTPDISGLGSAGDAIFYRV